MLINAKAGHLISQSNSGLQKMTSKKKLITTGSEIFVRKPVIKCSYRWLPLRLNNQKINHIISVLGKRQELGVKVTIVTWHHDAYKYGRDDVRMELMERLRKNGFEIRLAETPASIMR